MKNVRRIYEYPGYINMLAEYIINTVIPLKPNGFTIDSETLQMPVFPKSVFLVSRKDCEKKFYANPGVEDVANWIRQNSNLLFRRPGHFIGGWRNQGIFFLDITIAIKGKLAALNAAYANQQIAMYHPFSSNSFYLPNAA